MRVARRCDADDVVAQIERLVEQRGAPQFLRMDNGPEPIAWALREWCRLSGIGTCYIEPGSPWQTPYVESFNGRARDELLNSEEFGTLIEAQVVVEAWRKEYNTFRPHSALGGLTPAEFYAKWISEAPTGTLTLSGPQSGAPSTVSGPHDNFTPSMAYLLSKESCRTVNIWPGPESHLLMLR